MKIKKLAIPFLYLNKAIRCFKKDRGSFGLSYKIQHSLKRNKYKQLKRYKNIHYGEDCFIVGTGPSLRVEDVNLIDGKKSIGVNTLFKLYEKTDWRANYYCIIDPTTYKSIGDDVKRYHTDTLFIPENRIRENDTRVGKFSLECSSFYKIPYLSFFDEPCKFSDDLSYEIFDGASVVYVAVQIAVYMGFKRVFLLGVDCNYDKNIKLHNEVLEYSKDYNYNWTKQTGLTMIEGFKVAKKYADTHDVKIYNASRGGMLEIFPRVNLENITGVKA